MIAFSCTHCGMKFEVKPEFAGRSTRCPTCKQPLVVPPEATLATTPPLSNLDGPLSSLARAGISGHLTLAHHQPSAGADAPRSVADVLRSRHADGQRYLLEGEIARGGMGAVHRAVDCDIRREVAVKFLLDQSDPRKKARFVEEAQITGQLEHPNIVPIHELGVDARNHLFFSMKMVKGRSLQQVLQQLHDEGRGAEKEYSLGRLLNILVSVCHALAYTHSRGVVHRDLKPANIMIGDFGEVYVMDWGLAKVLMSSERGRVSAPSAASTRGADATPLAQIVATDRSVDDDKTMDGMVMGTALYMPPEQALGDIAAIDARSDIYSLGAILYEMLSLQPPVDKTGGFHAILLRVAAGEIVPPEKRVPARARQIPPELSAVAMKALAKEKNDRYPSVEALRRDIELYREGRSVSAREDSKREMVWKFVKRNQAFSVTATAAGLLLSIVLVWSSVANYRARRDTDRAYADYRQVEEDKRSQAKQSVPAFVRAARLAIGERQFDDAMAQVNVAVDFDPDRVDARLLRAQLLISRQEYAEAGRELGECLKRQPDHADAKQLAALCERAKKDDWPTLLAFAEVFERGRAWPLADVLTADLKRSREGRSKLLEVYRKHIEAAWKGRGPRLGLTQDGTFTLSIQDCPEVGDLSPLEGMPLTFLGLTNCGQVRDLSALKGLPLTWLDLGYCGQVRDLSPLKGMPLTFLNLVGCGQVRDLSPLKGMPLTYLNLWHVQVRDLSPLEKMPLADITLPPQVVRGMDVLRQIKTLAKINGMAAADFWKKYDAGEFKQYKP